MKGTEDDIVLKLLHTADWHLGRRFRSFKEEDARRLSRARLDAVDRLLSTAERSNVDAVLCAGDLFDEPAPGGTWGDDLAALFKKRDWKRPVFLLPGNHDPLVADAIWRDQKFRKQLPAYVHVVDEELAEYTLPNDCVLYAVPCQSKAGQSDPTKLIPKRKQGDERVRIGMVHGSTFDARDAQTNFPISKDAAVERGLDYLAIGDTHGFRFVPPERLQPPTIYPGTPEPTAFDELDPGHVAVVFINRQRRAMVQKQKVASWAWEQVTVRSLDELRRLAARADLGDRVLRVTVDMRVTAPEYEDAERLLENLGGSEARHGLAGVLDLHRERLELDVANVEVLSQELPEVLQAAVRRLKLAAEQPETRQQAQRALFHLFRTARKAS